MKKLSRRKIYGISLLATTGLIGLVCTLAVTNANLLIFGAQGQQNEYFVRLDSTNAYSGADQDIITSSGSWQIGFKYTNAVAKTNYHVTLNDGGTLVNTNLFKSLTSFCATFDGSGTLKARFSYDGSTWGSYTTLTSGQTITLGSNPYYAELSATGTVNIASATYEYSCMENPDAASLDSETTYNLITNIGSLKEGDEIAIVGYDSTANKYYTLQNTVYNTYYIDTSVVTVSDNEASITSSHHIWTVGKSGSLFTFKNSSNYLRGYINGTHYNAGFQTTLDDSCKWNVSINSSGIATFYVAASSNVYLEYYYKNHAEFTGYKSDAQNIYIYKKTVTDHYATPVNEVGFSATDSNASTYSVDSVFATDNNLEVKVLFDDSTSKVITSGYTYSIVKQGSSTPINPNEAFGTSGIYVLTVNYGSYIPTQINLTVGASLTAIEVNTSKLSYYTNDKLSDHLDKITANLSFSDSSLDVDNVAYSSFNDYNLKLTLINPSNVDASVSTAFGTAGTWTIKVESKSNAAVFGLLGITVNAVPVTSITMSETSISVQEEATHQLTATVGPDYATDTSVTWTSANSSIATVSETGLVTGVATGTTTITATANGGNDVVGTCTVEVTAKPVQTEFPATLTAGTNASDCTVNEQDAIKVGTSKKTGDMTITVGAGAVSMSFYAAGWGGTDTTLSLSTDASITFGEDSVTAIGDANISGNETAFTLAGNEEDYKITVDLFNVTDETTITVEGNRRFVLWNATYSTNSTPVEPVYPTSITLTGTSTISLDGTAQLTVTYTPSDTNVKEVTFTSSNDSVATVSSSGVVTGVAVGNATITATATAANSTTVSATFAVSVQAISVTSVSLNKASLTMTVDDTETLVPTISPSNATNKNVTWSSSAPTVASVDNGTVTALRAGTATITVTTVDGSKTATCTVTVNEKSSGGGDTPVSTGWTLVTSASSLTSGDILAIGCSSKGTVAGSLSSSYLASVSATFDGDTIPTLPDTAAQFTLGGSSGAWTLTSSSGQLFSSAAKNVNYSSNGTGTWSISISGGDATITSTTSSYGSIQYNASSPRFTTYTSSQTAIQLYKGGTAEPITATGVSISPTSLNLAAGQSSSLEATYSPSGANTGLDLNWTSSNSNITVSSTGTVTVTSAASVGQTATITASLKSDANAKSTCTVTVIEKELAAWTIMLYLCGSDLESENSLATSDITEILKVGSQPSDVNFIIETGGSSSWHYSGATISSSKLGRWHVSNKKLVKDDELTYSYMGSQSTLESFINWGYENYEAQKMGLIFWNHGGAMEGVCYDEKHSQSDTLKNNEVKGALANTLGSNKLEFIGYDACLMQVQEVAEFNSSYANYMIGSQESEAGEGWDYDTWLDDLYAKKSTETILTAIVDGFISDNGGVNGTGSSYQGTYYPCDQTLSWLKLEYMAAYKTAWENMATQLASKISANGKSGFNTNVMGKTKYFGDTDWARFGIFDVQHFLEVLGNNSTYNPGSTYINAVLTARSNLVGYSSSQQEAAHDAHGLCFNYYCGKTDYWGSSTKNYFTSTYSSFTNWCSLVNSYGGSFSTSYSY